MPNTTEVDALSEGRTTEVSMSDDPLPAASDPRSLSATAKRWACVMSVTHLRFRIVMNETNRSTFKKEH
jgi:hypothetical protein